MRTAARILVDQLVLQGVDRVFCVPGESFLAVLDALHDSPGIELVTCRHEGGAAMMAEAYGKLTGRPGVVFCSRGPGATNASSGLHVAFQDSTPMLMFIGQNPRDVLTREGFQEIDYRWPPNHYIMVPNALCDQRPDVVREVWRLLVESRKRATTGGDIDPWPVGIEANHKAIEGAIKFTTQQHMITKPVKVEDLFHPLVREIAP